MKTRKVTKSKKTKEINFNSNALIAAIEETANVAYTANGAITNKTTKSAVLDFFAVGSALRNRDNNEVLRLFSAAYGEDRLLALKSAFYVRDIRGGQGERKTFRTILSWLEQNDPQTVLLNLDAIPEFGRWDDLFELFNTSLGDNVLEKIRQQWDSDADSKTPSIMAKWLSSCNASSAKTRTEGHIIRTALGLTEKEYRQSLSILRAKLNVVERAMCSQDWKGIDYSHVPSRASLIYRKAFSKNDGERYTKFIQDVKSGKTKINASTLYPYDIVRNCLAGNGDSTLDVQWNALPNYMAGNERPGLVVADVSGSMQHGTSINPIDISISLAMYIAERNEGPFKDYFLTFSSNPELCKLRGKTITEKAQNLQKSNWGMSTDLQSTFDLILGHASKNKVREKDMPKFLLIVSDMEFNAACGDQTNFQAIKTKYKKHGYEMPSLIFWNVNGREGNNPVTMNQDGVALVSGASPSILKSVLSGRWSNPYELMLETLNNQRYSNLRVAAEQSKPIKVVKAKTTTKPKKVVKSKVRK
jgi:hypothetical protein